MKLILIVFALLVLAYLVWKIFPAKYSRAFSS